MTLKVSMDKEVLSSKKKTTKKSARKSTSVGNDAYDYFKIWAYSPSFNDINGTMMATKVGVLGGIIGNITFLVYWVFKDLIVSIFTGIFFLILFVIVFYEEMFSLTNFMSMKIRFASKIDPFKSLRFWTIDSEKKTLFHTNIKDLTTVGLRIFQVKTVADNVKPNYEHFFNSLSQVDIPFTYQVIQKPRLNGISSNAPSSLKMGKSKTSMNTLIYFCLFYDVKGILSKKKIQYLVEILDRFSVAIANAFDTNFRHHEITPLVFPELINAFKSLFFESDIPYEGKNKTLKRQNSLIQVFKCTYVGLLLIISSLLLGNIGIPLILILTWCIGLLIAFVVFYWRELLFGFPKISTSKMLGINLIDPFKDVMFYYYKAYPDCLFSVINNKLIIGTKIFNLSHSEPPLLDSQGKAIPRIEKFIQAIMTQKIPLAFTHVMSPMRFSTLEKKAWHLLNRKTQNHATWTKNASQQHNFMSLRKGIWRTIYTISIHEYMPINSFKMKYLARLEESLYEKEIIAVQAFNMNMINSRGEMLEKNKLISGFLLECVKNKHFRMNGTHLHYLMYQGKFLSYLVEIFPEFKKGIETRIASEFNTPLTLDNYITIGHTINTEVYRKEVEAGFTLDQLYEIFITGGSNMSRELCMMRIAIELIEARVPSIIFDFSGNWSKILQYFKDTRHEDLIHYFIFGKSFTINPVKSDIQYDDNNADYLKYVIDAFSLAFQKNDREIESLRQFLLGSDPDLKMETDATMIAKDLELTPDWKKETRKYSMDSMFSDFFLQDLKSLSFSSEYDDDITVRDIIEESNTMIIDLSQLKNLKQKVYTTFILLSKIIHYIKSGNLFSQKVLLIPNIEMIFNYRFLHMNVKHGMIDQFLEPLKNAGMGIIASSESLSFTHQHVFTYFSNYIALNITDKGDLSKVINLMNFRRLHEGIYSSKRNETFQVNYLMNMKPNQVIIRRSDIDQPFPVDLDLKALLETPRMSYEEIVILMKEHGYDFETSEKRIIQKTRKTIFKKDFDTYHAFIDEIIYFMDAVKKIDKIGNLYKNKLKDDLMAFIYPRAVKIAGTSKKKREFRNWRNDIFNILIRHGYLVENHPAQASGSESIRTSYSVGPQYERALADYYDSKRDASEEFITEIVSEESNKEDAEDISAVSEDQDEEQLINLLGAEMKTLFDNIFQIHRLLKTKKFPKALELEKEVINNFLEEIYQKFDQIPNERIDFDSFLKYLTNLDKFPINESSLKEFSNEITENKEGDGDIEQITTSFYEKLNDFFNDLSGFISDNER